MKVLSETGKPVLFVGTKKQAQEAIKEEAERCGMFYVNERWLGGMLTNFKTIRSRIARLEKLQKMEEDGKELESDRIGIFLPFHHFESRMKKYMEMANGIGLACRGNIVDMLRKKS